MTREEEIHKIANTISTNIGKDVDEDYICNDEYDFTIGFECGAKWADEHPNLYNDEKYHTVRVSDLDKLYRKSEMYDTFLEKACEWLQLNAIKYIRSIGGCMYFDVINSVNDFKKAMEE